MNNNKKLTKEQKFERIRQLKKLYPKPTNNNNRNNYKKNKPKRNYN